MERGRWHSRVAPRRAARLPRKHILRIGCFFLALLGVSLYGAAQSLLPDKEGGAAGRRYLSTGARVLLLADGEVGAAEEAAVERDALVEMRLRLRQRRAPRHRQPKQVEADARARHEARRARLR